MAASYFRVKPQGQTLVVDITTQADVRPTTVYTDSGFGTAHTFPVRITADTDFYFNLTGRLPYDLEVAQLDGSVVYSARHDADPDKPVIISPEPTFAQVKDDAGVFGHARKWKAGRYYGSEPHQVSTAANGTGVMTAIPLWVPAPVTIDRIAVEATATAATAVCRLGIYESNEYDLPDNLLLDAGTVDVSSAAVVEATVSQALDRGLYWLAAVSQVASATMRSNGSVNNPTFSGATAGSMIASTAQNCYFKSGITGALADWGSTVTPTNGGYKVIVRAA